jgi:hypothetical protein
MQCGWPSGDSGIMGERIEVHVGSDNVFADLGLTDAEAHRVKAELASRIGEALGARRLTQAAAAELLMRFCGVAGAGCGDYGEVGASAPRRVWGAGGGGGLMGGEERAKPEVVMLAAATDSAHTSGLPSVPRHRFCGDVRLACSSIAGGHLSKAPTISNINDSGR